VWVGDVFPKNNNHSQFFSIFYDIRSIELIEGKQRVCTAAGNEYFEEDTKYFQDYYGILHTYY